MDASDVTVGWAEELPGWLHASNYDQGTQSRVIELADQTWQRARKHKLVEENVFEGLTRNKRDLPKYNRLGNDRKQEEAPAWSVEQICALARVLRPIYLLPFWLCVGMGFRLAEPFGFKLADWNSADSELYVGYQRPASAAKGRKPLKVPKSERPLPVPGVLAQCIDRYIAENHPPKPTDPTALIAWGDRYLLVGAQGGPMDSRSFALAVSGAYQVLGITSDLYGCFRPVHHLRKTLGGVLQAAARQAGFPASAVSILLGHLIKDEDKADRPARTTERFYSPKVVGEIGRLIAYLERWICEEVLVVLGTSDLLDITGMDDPISLDRAVELLNKSGLDHDVHDVLRHAALGEVLISRVNFTNDAAKQEPVVSEASVIGLLRDLDREQSDTYSATEAAKLLVIDHPGVYQLVAKGDIVETTTDGQRRRGAPGYNTGSLPGGGRRFPKESVDEFASRHQERIERASTWLTVGQAAAVIGCSTATVRRLVDSGHFTQWRDPLSAHQVRMLDPKEVIAYAAKVAEVSVIDAAATLGVSELTVQAWIKCDWLTAGSRKCRVLCSSIERVLGRGQGASVGTPGAPPNSASNARGTGADRLAS